jgi:hypothetical protein
LTSPFFYFSSEGANGLGRGKRTTFTARERSVSSLKRREKFNAATLPLFPQGERFLYGFFFAVQAAALDCLPDKRLLVGGEGYFHVLRLSKSLG